MTREEKIPLAIAACSAAGAGIIDMAEWARHECNLTITEVVENFADATKLAIEVGGHEDEDVMQLYGALVRFLEGWAPEARP